MRTTIRFYAVILCLLVPILVRMSSAQTVINALNNGWPLNGKFDGTHRDSVQLNNGNLHIEIPIWHASGRGIDTGVNLQSDNMVWTLITHCNTTYGYCSDNTDEEVGTNEAPHLVDQSTNYTFGEHSYAQNMPGGGSCYNCSDGTWHFHGNYVLREPGGTKHHFVPDPIVDPFTAGQQDNDGYPTMRTLYADDGSGWILQVDATGSPLKATAKSGLTVTGGQTTDANGNFAKTIVTPQDVIVGTDTLGRSFSWDGSYVDETGTRRTLNITTTSVSESTQKCYFTESDVCTEASGTSQFPHVITFPDGTNYTFEYAQNQGGEIVSMSLPTGGRIQYTYADTWSIGGRPVTSRTTNDGSTVGKWSYMQVYNDANNAYGCGQYGTLTIVTDPAGNDVKHCFDVPTPDGPPGHETAEYVYRGPYTANNLLKTVISRYTYIVPPGNNYTGSITLPSGEITTWNDSNETAERDIDYEVIHLTDPTPSQLGDWSGDITFGNVSEVREYAFGSGSPGSLLRKTDNAYWHQSNPVYQTVGITGLLSQQTIADGSGNIVSKKTFAYDENGLQSVTGATSHDDANFGTSQTIRGNLTTESSLRADGSSSVAKSWFNSLGEVIKSQDPNQVASNSGFTATSFADSWAESSCVSGGTYAFPTSVTNALGQTSSSSYFSCTSALASSTDANNKTTSWSYDLDGNIVSESRPDGGVTSVNYNGYANPRIVTTTTTATPDPSIVTSRQLDGLGRVVKTTNAAGAEVDTLYDAFGNTKAISNAYFAPSNSTSSTTYSYVNPNGFYDPLGRIWSINNQDGTVISKNYLGSTTTQTDEAGNNKSLQTDALGRLIKVIEPGGITTSYAYDAMDNLLSANQSGTQSRTFTYDWSSRLLTATNPETGMVCYGQLSGGNCTGGYDANGNLLYKTDARGLTTSHTYDALNRLTDKIFTDGTPGQHFRYDQTSVWMGSQYNTVGRLSEAYTDLDMRHPNSGSAQGCNPQSSATANYNPAYGNPTYCN